MDHRAIESLTLQPVYLPRQPVPATRESHRDTEDAGKSIRTWIDADEHSAASRNQREVQAGFT